LSGSKLLGTFAQLVPGTSSVGVVVNPASPGAVAQMDGTQQAVHALGIQSQVVNAATQEEYDRAFARLKIEGVNGVLLLADLSNDAYAGKIAELAQQYRLPTAFQLRNNVQAGGLMSYGADNNDQFRLPPITSLAKRLDYCWSQQPHHSGFARCNLK